MLEKRIQLCPTCTAFRHAWLQVMNRCVRSTIPLTMFAVSKPRSQKHAARSIYIDGSSAPARHVHETRCQPTPVECVAMTREEKLQRIAENCLYNMRWKVERTLSNRNFESLKLGPYTCRIDYRPTRLTSTCSGDSRRVIRTQMGYVLRNNLALR